MMPRRFPFFFFLLTLAILHGAELTTQISSDQITKQEAVELRLTIIVSEEKQTAQPAIQIGNFPTDFPFHVRAFPPQTSMQHFTQITNGRVENRAIRSIIYLYRLLPKRTGRLQIPSLPVTVNGQQLHSDSIFVLVSEDHTPQGNENRYTFEQKLTPESTVPGQPVTLRYSLIVPRNTRLYQFETELPLRELENDFRLPDLSQKEFSRRNFTRNGISYSEVFVELELLPKHTGEITLPDASVSFAIPDETGRSRRRSNWPFDEDDGWPFGGMFGGRDLKRIQLLAKPLSLHVAPLPEEGKPANFSGIIGAIQAEASLEPNEASVGDPMLLTIKLSGQGALKDSALPSFAELPELQKNFTISDENEPGRIAEDGSIVFQRTIRPKLAGKLTFPALTIPYYNPTTQKYESTQTSPLEILASATKKITLADATGNGANGIAPSPVTIPQPSAPQTLSGRLAPNAPWQEMLSPGLFSNPRIVRSKGFLAFFLLPPTLFLLCLFVRLLQEKCHSSPEKRRAKAAAGKALSRLDALRNLPPAEMARQLHPILQDFFLERFQMPPGAISYQDVEKNALAAGFKPSQITPFRELFQQAEEAQFAGTAVDLPKFLEAFQKALKGF